MATLVFEATYLIDHTPILLIPPAAFTMFAVYHGLKYVRRS